MMQSQEVDFNDDDDEECDCEVCQAERAREASDDGVEQVAIDRVSDTEWKICDFEETDHPLTYILLVTEVSGNPYVNKRITLAECDCDNFDNEFQDYAVFIREVWSTEMYIGAPAQYEITMTEICEMLPSLTISNPIEITYFFGGQVHNKDVNMPPMPDVN